MRRLLLPFAAIFASLAVILGAAWFGATAEPAEPSNCPITAKRFFTTEHVLSDGTVQASHYVLLENPDARARAYALHFDHALASERRDGARATLPGERSVPVLLGREHLAAGAAWTAPAALGAATRITCRG